MSGKSKITWASQPLGKIADKELSRRLGVSLSTVKRARSRLNIPSFKTGARVDFRPQTDGYGDAEVPSDFEDARRYSSGYIESDFDDQF